MSMDIHDCSHCDRFRSAKLITGIPRIHLTMAYVYDDFNRESTHKKKGVSLPNYHKYKTATSTNTLSAHKKNVYCDSHWE